MGLNVKAAFFEEGGAEGKRGRRPIQRAEGAARNEQATEREHATIECRGLLSPERRFLPQKTFSFPSQNRSSSSSCG